MKYKAAVFFIPITKLKTMKVAILFACIICCNVTNAQQSTVIISSSNPSVTTANLEQGSANNPIYNFTLTVHSVAATLSTINFTNTNAADILNYKLWYNTNNSMSGATSLAPVINTTLGTGLHVFTLAAPLKLAVGISHHFFITTDVAAAGTSTVNNVLSVSAPVTALTFIDPAPVFAGTAHAGAVQTITGVATEDTTQDRLDLGFGGSFDFKEGINTAKFFYSFNFQKPSAFCKKSGFMFGVYQTATSGFSDSVNYQLLPYFNRSSRTESYLLKGNDSVRITKAQVNGMSRSQEIKTLGGYFNILHLLSTRPAQKAKVYGLLNMEYARRSFKTTYNYNVTALDTITIPTDSLLYYSAAGSHTKTSFSDEAYFGAGLLLKYISRHVDFNICGILGAGNYNNWQVLCDQHKHKIYQHQYRVGSGLQGAGKKQDGYSILFFLSFGKNLYR